MATGTTATATGSSGDPPPGSGARSPISPLTVPPVSGRPRSQTTSDLDSPARSIWSEQEVLLSPTSPASGAGSGSATIEKGDEMEQATHPPGAFGKSSLITRPNSGIETSANSSSSNLSSSPSPSPGSASAVAPKRNSSRPDAPQNLSLALPLAQSNNRALTQHQQRSMSRGDRTTPDADTTAAGAASFLPALISPSQIDVSDITRHALGAAGTGENEFSPASATTMGISPESYYPSITPTSAAGASAAGVSPRSMPVGANTAGEGGGYTLGVLPPYGSGAAATSSTAAAGAAAASSGSHLSSHPVPAVDESLSRNDTSIIAPFEDGFGGPDGGPDGYHASSAGAGNSSFTSQSIMSSSSHSSSGSRWTGGKRQLSNGADLLTSGSRTRSVSGQMADLMSGNGGGNSNGRHGRSSTSPFSSEFEARETSSSIHNSPSGARPRTPPGSGATGRHGKNGGSSLLGTPNLGGNSGSASSGFAGFFSRDGSSSNDLSNASGSGTPGGGVGYSAGSGAEASVASLLSQPPTPNTSRKKMGFTGFFKKKSTKDIKSSTIDLTGSGVLSFVSTKTGSERLVHSPAMGSSTNGLLPGAGGSSGIAGASLSQTLQHMSSSPSLHSSRHSVAGGGAGGSGWTLRGQGTPGKHDATLGIAIGLDEEIVRPPPLPGHHGSQGGSLGSGSATSSLGPAFGGTGAASGAGAGPKEKKLSKLRRPKTSDRDHRSESSTPGGNGNGANGATEEGSTTPNLGTRELWGTAVMDATGNGPNNRGAIQTPSQEIAGFSLDTNFDRIDDFVDISVRQRDPNADGLIGPLPTVEGSSPIRAREGSSPSGGGTLSSFSSSSRPRTSSVSTASTAAATSAASTTHRQSKTDRPQPGVMGSAARSHSGGPSFSGLASVQLQPGSPAVGAAARPEPSIDVSRPGLRKLTRSQYQALIKNGSQDLGNRPLSEILNPGDPTSAAAAFGGTLIAAREASLSSASSSVSSSRPFEVETSNATATAAANALLQPRKDSAASGRSDHSGVSPKSSYAHLPQLSPSLTQEANTWLTEGRNHFNFPAGSGTSGTAATTPPASNQQQRQPQPQRQSRSSRTSSSALGISDMDDRKTSSSSTAVERQSKKSSNWMAPDSWAVQPDKSRAISMEEEQDSDEDEVGVAGTTPMRRNSSSADDSSVVLAGGARQRTWSAAEIPARLTADQPRRSTGDSAFDFQSPEEEVAGNAGAMRAQQSSTGSIPPLARRPSDIEILHGPKWQTHHLGMGSWGMSTSNMSSAQTEVLVSPHSNTHHPHHTPKPASSRGGGGALAAASGAAASAASKLGLRGPSRSGRHVRPATAGSIGVAEHASRATGGSLGGASADDDHMSSSTAAMSAATSKDSGRTSRRPGTATGATTVPAAKPHLLRIWRKDGSFVTLSCALLSTTSDIKTLLARKSLSTDNAAYRLFVRDKGNERPLGPSEKPALIQRRRLEQAGYTDIDNLEDMGREDLSYLLKFVYRPDIVPTFDSESFGNEEHMFQHLDLQGRNLEMVPIFLYKHADWIVSLDLSGNPMSDVPSDFMQMCSNLRSLRLSSLALKRLPQGVRQSETLTHLDVSNNRIPDITHAALDSCIELTQIKAQNNRLYDLPTWFARIETLRYLNLSNNRFEVFPPILCQASGLIDLDISFNAISSLPSQIDQLTNLQRLVFVGNSVEGLPDSMSSLAKLQTIDLRRNLIQDVSVLFTMPQINVVQCEHNSIRQFNATLGAKMRTLEVGQNPLTKVTLGVHTASDLTTLNLSYANMAKLDEDLFKLLPSLTELILDRNQFVTLPDSIGELSNLTTFTCNNNNLATLPDSIGKLKKLTRLNVQNNNLKSLPNSIWHCSALWRLNVTSNLLETFPAPPLALADGDGRKGSTGSHNQVPPTPVARQLPPLARSLRKLRLGDNRLGDDVFSALTTFIELEVLNLSFNEIYEVPATTLAHYKRLQELYLSGNSLSSVPADDLVDLQELRILHLNGNKLQTLPAELGRMRRLANLDVGNNNLKYNIANWTYDWNWNSNPELRYLNLSGNKRLEIKSKIVEVNGRRKNMSDFSRLLSLRVLGLMDVTMTLQSTPDEGDNRRVRTSLSQINNMAYGIADTLGKHDNLNIIDVVVPSFRKDEAECLFGLFDGRAHDPSAGSRIARHLAEWVSFRIEREMLAVERADGDAATIPDIMRRAFLRMNKEYADALINEGQRRGSETLVMDDKVSIHRASLGPRALWRAGASAIIAYISDRTLHIANAGDALAVLSRNGGQAELVSIKHEPFDRQETERIRSAEGWVSLRGFVNDTLDVSRGFGYYHLSPVVNAAPAVTTIQLSDADEFIIIANRVLWEFLSYQTAVDIARMERDDPMIAAQRLRDLAISYGAEDSIMVMIVSVSDLFFARPPRNAGMGMDPATEIFKKTQRRPREVRDLPGDRTLARLEREVAPPIGQIALVFTDIKNSTSLWETNGGMQSAMRLHNTLLRRQLRTVGGYEVKTEGDAFMCSFPSVSAALLWCFNVQLQLLREDWPQEILESEDGKEIRDANGEPIYRGLWVRMGLHWGFPVCEPDPVTRRMDYFGPMVNRAARISGAADGGQILVSKDVVNELNTLLSAFGETEEEVDDVDEDEFRLLNPNVSRDVVLLRRMGFGISDLGERRLKGLETPESLFLVYPKQLSGRLEADGRSIAPSAQVFEPTVQLLDIDEVKQIGLLCLRLEALSAGHVFPGVFERADAKANQVQAECIAAMEKHPGSSAIGPNALARRKGIEAELAVHPELLIYVIRDDAPDDELAGILEQLITRITNAVSKLQLDALVTLAEAGLDLGQLQQKLRAIRSG